MYINCVPSVILHLCMIYYMTTEHFILHDSISLNDEKTIIKATKQGFKTIYGNIKISNYYPTIYKWCFKIIAKRDAICIGIDSSNKKYIDNDFSSPNVNSNPFYAYYNGGLKYGHKISFNGEKYADPWGVGNKIKMELNTKTKTLKFYVDNKDQGIAFYGIDFGRKYNMAVFMYAQFDSVQLLDFQIDSISD